MRKKNKLTLHKVLPKANDLSGLLGKGVSESEIMLAGELFKRQMVEKRRKRSAKAQSKAEAEAYRGYGGYRGGYGGYRGDTGDSVTEVVRPEDKRRLLQNEFQEIAILGQSLPFEGIVLLIIK